MFSGVPWVAARHRPSTGSPSIRWSSRARQGTAGLPGQARPARVQQRSTPMDIFEYDEPRLRAAACLTSATPASGAPRSRGVVHRIEDAPSLRGLIEIEQIAHQTSARSTRPSSMACVARAFRGRCALPAMPSRRTDDDRRASCPWRLRSRARVRLARIPCDCARHLTPHHLDLPIPASPRIATATPPEASRTLSSTLASCLSSVRVPRIATDRRCRRTRNAVHAWVAKPFRACSPMSSTSTRLPPRDTPIATPVCRRPRRARSPGRRD